MKEVLFPYGKTKVSYVSEMTDEVIRNMHMIPAHSIDEAISMAKEQLGRDKVKITAIPDGVSVMIESFDY